MGLYDGLTFGEGGGTTSILVTGAFGLLGSNLCYDFLRDRKKAVAYDWVVGCHDIVEFVCIPVLMASLITAI